MTQRAYSIRQARCTDFTSEQVGPVQRRVLRIKPENGNAQLIGSLASVWKNTAAHEDHSGTTVSDRDRGGTFHQLDVEVSGSVIDPTEIARGVQVARSSIIARRDNGVARAEIDHPSATELCCLRVVRAPRHRFRKQRIHVHGSRLHPTAEIATVRVSTKR